MASELEDTPWTPGPWAIHYKADHVDGTDLPWIGGHMGRPLAFISHETILKPDLKRAQANARLIAAAPDMAEELAQQADGTATIIGLLEGQPGPVAASLIGMLRIQEFSARAVLVKLSEQSA